MSISVIAGRYAVQARLGAPSSQGTVYRVLDTYEGDVVALKLLTALPPGGPWMEAQILRHLADPHILPIRNADQVPGRPYLVTELATRGSLEDCLAATGSRGLGVDDVVRWTRQACYGVARAHDLRLLHNDLKPGNLFLNAQGECLVGDFGMATLIPPGAAAVRPYGATAETAAPEVAACWNTAAATASVLSDVYSLGATAFWLLAARPPHEFTGAPDPAVKMATVAGQVPSRLRDVAPHVPQSVALVIEKAFARSPGDRFATVTAFAAALGTRRRVTRRWRRTDEHVSHVACWRGEPEAGGSTYVLCLETSPRPSQCLITAVHASSGNRVTRGCRTAYMREWGRAVRSAMQRLG
jgi:eukaryotic-like serine/threonine-protein kinase